MTSLRWMPRWGEWISSQHLKTWKLMEKLITRGTDCLMCLLRRKDYDVMYSYLWKIQYKSFDLCAESWPILFVPVSIYSTIDLVYLFPHLPIFVTVQLHFALDLLSAMRNRVREEIFHTIDCWTSFSLWCCINIWQFLFISWYSSTDNAGPMLTTTQYLTSLQDNSIIMLSLIPHQSILNLKWPVIILQ